MVKNGERAYKYVALSHICFIIRNVITQLSQNDMQSEISFQIIHKRRIFMKIANVRIDERLIHGQVAAYWTRALNADRILVVDDFAAKDQIQKMALKMATPQGVKLSILTVPTASKNLLDKKYEGENVFVIVRNPKTLEAMVDEGMVFEKVNVGNMSSKHGSVQVRRSVGVTPADVESFKKLLDKGVALTAQMVPNDEVVDFGPIITSEDIFR